MVELFKEIFLLVTFLLLLFFCQNVLHAQQTKPNIVFFLIDDLGYSDVGAYGSDYYETPNIDRLAEEGVKFTNAYSSSMICSPTRAAILTGKNPARLHITHAIPIQGYMRLENTKMIGADYVKNLPLEEVTIAEALKEAGYKTAAIGKWHVSWEEWGYPENQGFDINIGGNNMGNPGDYSCPYYGKWRMTEEHSYTEWNVVEECEEGEYLTDRLTDETIKFIEKSKEEPFFAYVQHYAVHTPLRAKDNLIQKYESKPADSMKGHTNSVYAAMIESVDESVGRIASKLNELGLSENTIVIFTSDHGGHGRITSNWPFRGNKGNFYEGGIRVPLIIKWLGNISPGVENNTPVISTDFYPTILGLADLPLKSEQHVDGMDFSPMLLDGKDIKRTEPLYWHYPNYVANHPGRATPQSIIRDGDWKMFEYLEDGTVELYNLRKDMKEEHNLADQFPERIQQLKNKLDAWRKETQVQMPIPNPDYQSDMK